MIKLGNWSVQREMFSNSGNGNWVDGRLWYPWRFSLRKSRDRIIQPPLPQSTKYCVCQSLSHAQLFAIPQTSPTGSSVHGILWARILEWVAISFSRGIFPTQGLTLSLLSVLYVQVDSLPLAPPRKPTETSIVHVKIYILYGSTFVVYEKQIWSFTMR